MSAARKNLVDILLETRLLLALPDNDFVWSNWDDARSALAELDHYIRCVETSTAFEPSGLRILFAPTGSLQEVSLSSGWADEYLRVAARFDSAYAEYERHKTG